ncbi:hypothetical protein [Rhodoblastus sp.]|uniref:hypothetical protein n=1 Tax=Rhodoblastus sp. TaxID=1962975 RepID=UPI003F9858F6
MKGIERQLLRFGLVIALGSGLAFVAAHAAGQKVAVRHNQAPIVLAVALERNAGPAQDFAPDAQTAQQEPRVDQCAYDPHASTDNHLLGDKSAHGVKKHKVVVCG